MSVTNLVIENSYRDSVMLMRVSRQLEDVEGVEQATAIMGTENNKTLLEVAALLTDEGRRAQPNDIILALKLAAPDDEPSVIAKAQELLTSDAKPQIDGGGVRPKTLDGAVSVLSGANLALLSIPGEYASYEAAKALDKGLHVLMFSDNVPIEEEVELKRHAIDKGLFMLGPDCGTAIINNVPLGFANEVAVGRVGLVSASGTGLQQVVCLLDAAGEGVSQALGVGGRDLDDKVGGVMMLEGLKALNDDQDTEVIVLISKPPGPVTRGRILDELEKCSKPCVVCFLGADESSIATQYVYLEPTLDSATSKALQLLGHDNPESVIDTVPREQLEALNNTLGEGPRYIRGLYSGGTLCYEALLTLRRMDDRAIYSNLALPDVGPLTGDGRQEGHALLDLGDDEFTVGTPHPIIDMRQRCERLVREASDPNVGVLLLDVMLGHGAHPDPASELAPALREAQSIAADTGRGLACVVVLCGTVGDPQSLARQRAELASVGAVVVSSNAQAARISMALSLGDLGLIQKDS